MQRAERGWGARGKGLVFGAVRGSGGRAGRVSSWGEDVKRKHGTLVYQMRMVCCWGRAGEEKSQLEKKSPGLAGPPAEGGGGKPPQKNPTKTWEAMGGAKKWAKTEESRRASLEKGALDSRIGKCRKVALDSRIFRGP